MKWNKTIMVLAILALFSGCKKYLTVVPRNVRSVSGINDIKSVLGTYLNNMSIRPTNTPPFGPTVLLNAENIMMFEGYSDNIDFEKSIPPFLIASNFAIYGKLLLWNQFTSPTLIWNEYYETIGALNALIDQTDEITTATQGEKDIIKGEMLVHRAYYFFKLLQYFAPYDQEAIGIPVNLHTGREISNLKLDRKPQAEVYKVIITDLVSALEMIERTPSRPTFNLFYHKNYINNILAQVYWFKANSAVKETGDYLHAKTYALAAIDGVDVGIPTTSDQINLVAQGLKNDYQAFYQIGNTLTGTTTNIYGSASSSGTPNTVRVSRELYSLYQPGDIRLAAYFRTTDSTISSNWPDGKFAGNRYPHYSIFQPEEAYLILAEALYYLNETTECITVLNRFKGFRNAGSATGLSGTALLQEILNERRKEMFSNTDKRWIDLKRYANITITRKLTINTKEYNIAVAPNDFRYSLPIPFAEIQNNPDLTINDGWVEIAF